jgi:hypothetical protein
MPELWKRCEEWKLRLMNDGHQVDEVMCDGAPPGIGAKVYYETFGEPNMGRPTMKRITAVVTAQDAHVDYNRNCYLLVIARVESSGMFPMSED